MKIKKTVGIMGGMGPLATADLISNIVAHTKAERDSDHVHLLIDCDGTVPDRTEAILHGGESPLVKLCTMAKNLEFMGADLIAISCNTSHYYYDSSHPSPCSLTEIGHSPIIGTESSRN